MSHLIGKPATPTAVPPTKRYELLPLNSSLLDVHPKDANALRLSRPPELLPPNSRLPDVRIEDPNALQLSKPFELLPLNSNVPDIRIQPIRPGAGDPRGAEWAMEGAERARQALLSGELYAPDPSPQLQNSQVDIRPLLKLLGRS